MADDVLQSSRWSALLMAGGQSRRMGRDKATLVIGGEELWRRQVRTLRETGFGEVMIARGEREPLGSGQPGLSQVSDAAQGCGPLGGLITGMRQAKTRWMLVLAVDLPLMPAGFLRKMMDIAEAEARGVVPTTSGRFEPLVAVYPSECLMLAEECLLHQQWSLQRLVERCVEEGLVSSFKVAEQERVYFRNVNTPDDLAEVATGRRA